MKRREAQQTSRYCFRNTGNVEFYCTHGMVKIVDVYTIHSNKKYLI
jgi:hypothetical protein